MTSHKIIATILIAGTMSFGCHKKESSEAPISAGGAEAPQANANASQIKQPTTVSVSPDLKEVQSAMQTKNYDQATTLMLNMQRSASQMTPDQAAAYANQMRSFQQSLAAAAAAGDQRAIEAARRLAQSRHR